MANTQMVAGKSNGQAWRIAGWSLLAALFVLPIVLMAFTREMNWGPADFVFFALMLAMIGGGFELAARLSSDWTYRAGAAMAILGSFLLVWINLAVGIIGGEDHPANLLFGAVLLLWVATAIMTRFRPGGMSVAMALAALAQASIACVTLIAGWGATEPPGAIGILTLNLLFVAGWSVAAALFRAAASDA